MDRGREDCVVRKARLSPNVLFRELSGEAVLLDLASERYYGLDEVGTRIWQLMTECGRTDKVLQVMLNEYEVGEAQMRQELDEFLLELADAGLIELERQQTKSIGKVL